MSFGFESINDWGTTQISSDLKHLHVLQEGTLGPTGYPGTQITFSNGGQKPLIVTRGGPATYIFTSTTTARIIAPSGCSYKVLGTTYLTPAGSGFGLEVYNSTGNLVFDNSQSMFSIAHIASVVINPAFNIDSGMPYILSGLPALPAGKSRWASNEYWEAWRYLNSIQPVWVNPGATSLTFTVDQIIGPTDYYGETDNFGVPRTFTIISGY